MVIRSLLKFYFSIYVEHVCLKPRVPEPSPCIIELCVVLSSLSANFVFAQLPAWYSALSWSFMDVHTTVQHLSCLPHMFPGEAELGDPLPSYFSFHTANKCIFHGLFNALVFLLDHFLLIKMTSKHSAWSTV